MAKVTNSWPSLADRKLELTAGVGQVRGQLVVILERLRDLVLQPTAPGIALIDMLKQRFEFDHRRIGVVEDRAKILAVIGEGPGHGSDILQALGNRLTILLVEQRIQLRCGGFEFTRQLGKRGLYFFKF